MKDFLKKLISFDIKVLVAVLKVKGQGVCSFGEDMEDMYYLNIGAYLLKKNWSVEYADNQYPDVISF